MLSLRLCQLASDQPCHQHLQCAQPPASSLQPPGCAAEAVQPIFCCTIHCRYLAAQVHCNVMNCRQDIDRARQQWQIFMATAPSYPEGVFRGQGIATLAGGGQYMVPAWVNIHMLRRTGACSCTCFVALQSGCLVAASLWLQTGCRLASLLPSSRQSPAVAGCYFYSPSTA